MRRNPECTKKANAAAADKEKPKIPSTEPKKTTPEVKKPPAPVRAATLDQKPAAGAKPVAPVPQKNTKPAASPVQQKDAKRPASPVTPPQSPPKANGPSKPQNVATPARKPTVAGK